MNILIGQTSNIVFKESFEIMSENIKKWIGLSEMLKSRWINRIDIRPLPQIWLLPSISNAIEMWSAAWNMWAILYDAYLSYEQIFDEKVKIGINIFDKVFYSIIIVIMGSLFYAMGAAMATLYKNAWSMV